jgi:hypothetical protein
MDINVSEQHTVFSSLALKMEIVRLSETLISTYNAIRRYNPEDKRNTFTAVRTPNTTLTVFLLAG